MEEYTGIITGIPIIQWEWSMIMWIIAVLLLILVGILLYKGDV